MIEPTLTFFTGTGTVTGANFGLSVEGGGKGGKTLHVLVDCGMTQGSKDAEDSNYEPFGYNPADMDVLIVTHAHLDHVGRIPKLVKEGFKGVIYSTPCTRDVAALILEDARNIMSRSAAKEGRAPMYDEHDIASALELWKTVEYHESFELGAHGAHGAYGDVSGVKCLFKDAGHILGSTIVEISVPDGTAKGGFKKVVFTGDLGNTPTPILRDTEVIDDADYMVMESVYGDRNHEPHEERLKNLERIIKETHERQGTLIIPAFSVERTQVLLFEINTLVESRRIPEMPVFLDSPLATKVTAVYHSYQYLFNDTAQAKIKSGDDVFNFPRLTVSVSGRDSRDISKTKGPKIIIAGSGMSMGGRVRMHEAEYLPHAHNTILLVGYQPVGTLGRELQNKGKSVTVDGRKVPVKARIECIFGYSAHKDSNHLVEFVSHSAKSLKKVFVAMGEPKASTFLAQRFKDELGVSAIVPERNKPYRLG